MLMDRNGRHKSSILVNTIEDTLAISTLPFAEHVLQIYGAYAGKEIICTACMGTCSAG